MRYCRFELKDTSCYGLIESVAGRDEITRCLLRAPEEAGSIDDVPSKPMTRIPLSEASLLVPVQPTKIVCVGRNYRAHAAELGHEVPEEPLIFLKPPSSLLPSGATIRRPAASERVDYEGELAVIIGRRCYKPSPDEDIRDYILAYTACNDVTARDLQKKDPQWTRGKGFDTFCPAGPIVTDEIDPWAGITVETRVNKKVRQKGNTRDLIFPLDVVIRYIAAVMTLFPGDLIATGTPEGVGPLVAGDTVEVEVEGIGTLRNPVAEE